MELHDHPSGNSRQYWENTPNGKIRAVYLDVSGDDIRVYHSDKEVVATVMRRGQKVIHLLIIDVKRVREELCAQLGHSEEPAEVAATEAAMR
jgi:hypothetical protein